MAGTYTIDIPDCTTGIDLRHNGSLVVALDITNGGLNVQDDGFTVLNIDICPVTEELASSATSSASASGASTKVCNNLGTDTKVILVGNDGTRFDLITESPPYSLADGSTFRGMAAWAVDNRLPGPEIHGEAVGNVRAVAKTFVVPVIIHGTTELQRDQNLAAITKVLSPQVGPCRIIYQRSDGTQREITAMYIGGAENLEVNDLARSRYTTANLVFRAHFPFWRQVDSTSGTSTGTFNNAYFAQANEVDMFNAGDVRTWPEWTITGPAENIHLANVTTGQVVRVLEVLATGQTCRIVSDPLTRGVYLDDDLNWSIVDPNAAEMWPLIPGTNKTILRATFPTDDVGGSWSTRWPILWESA